MNNLTGTLNINSISDVVNSYIDSRYIDCNNQGTPIKLDKYLEFLHFTIYDLENENSILKKKVEELYYRRGVSY